jgi:hypothetical protein
MTVTRSIHAIAGALILTTVALGWFVNPWFFAFTAFVGANLLQSAFTRWCLMASLLRRFGMKDEVAGATVRPF